MIYNAIVNKKDFKKFERLASESKKYARLAIKKSDQLGAILTMLEYKLGIVNEYKTVEEIFKKLKIRK